VKPLKPDELLARIRSAVGDVKKRIMIKFGAVSPKEPRG
jgi:hypothetical protein